MNVNIQQLLANVNVQNAVIDVSNLLNGNQIQALVQALNQNPQAAQNSQRLTSALRNQGALSRNERVVGVKDGEIFKMNPRTARTAQGRSPPRSSPASASPSSTSSASPAASSGLPNLTAGNVTQNATGVNLGHAMLSGLVNVNVQQIMANVNVQNLVVSVSDVLNQNDIQVLLQALNNNPRASQNASRLTDALRQRQVLAPNERVVGVANGKVFKNPAQP